jgi:hypothetical protein
VTLILSALTQDYVVQVSDQRIVAVPSFRVEDDDTVKAVLYDNHTTFASTGLARLPRSEAVQAAEGGDSLHRDAPYWLGEVMGLPAGTIPDMLENIRVEAAKSMAKAPHGPYPHAFVGVGWSGTPLVPTFYQVWNYPNGQAEQVFEVGMATLDRPLAWNASKPIPPKVEKKCGREIKVCVERDLGPATVARILRRTIRTVANTDGTVGRGLIEVCLPRRPVVAHEAEQEWRLSAKEPNLERASFRYFPTGEEESVPGSPIARLGPLLTEELIPGEEATFQSVRDDDEQVSE